MVQLRTLASAPFRQPAAAGIAQPPGCLNRRLQLLRAVQAI
jgi:hypothetical protein